MKLVQKKFPYTTTYSVGADHLFVEVQTAFSKASSRIAFDYITEDTFEYWSYSRRWLGVSLFFTLSFVAWSMLSPGLVTLIGSDLGFFLGTISVCSLLAFLFSWNSYFGYYITDGTDLAFLKGKPDHKSLDRFLSLLMARKREFLELQYSGGAATDPRFSLSQELQRLHRLTEQGVLSEMEFLDIKRNMIAGEPDPDSDLDDFLRGGDLPPF